MTSLLDKYIYWITRVASWVWKVIDLVILVTFHFAGDPPPESVTQSAAFI